MYQPRIILHPTDYSDCARHAFSIAVDLACQNHSRLIVLHVVDTLGPEHVGYHEAMSQRQPETQQRHLREELHQIQPPPNRDVHLQHILAEGDPARVIAEVAAREHCDLIVMGTYGRNILSRLLTGSVTQKVSHLTTCPLLTVRLPAPPP
jgi:nucleotide-binding universal stress UspA family protein